jgi:hypothetical protein
MPIVRFDRVGQWHEISECGAYTVAASRVGDRFKFQAWKLAAEKGKSATLLATRDDAEAARQACRDHKDGRLAA